MTTLHTYLTPHQTQTNLDIRDLSDPAAGAHAMQRLIDDVIAALQQAWDIPARIERGSRLVSAADNYDLLGYPADGAARNSRYTRWIDADHLLRTQTSAIIPGALRQLNDDGVDTDTLLACPGIVYRRDTVDRWHVGCPHQLDLWRIGEAVTDNSDMQEMIRIVLTAAVPGMQWRANQVEHPYTRNGLELEVYTNEDGWIEVGECGLASEAVLHGAGIDGHGLAMGLGLDRLLMIRKGIRDIRLLRDEDPRVQAQLGDLLPWHDVSSQPAVLRDISIAIAVGNDIETVGDGIREGLSDEENDILEAIEVLSQTSAIELPPQALERMGMSADQENWLLRLTLRHPSRTMTNMEANEVRNRIYSIIHQGARSEVALN